MLFDLGTAKSKRGPPGVLDHPEGVTDGPVGEPVGLRSVYHEIEL